MENITTQLLENGNLLVTIPISLRSQRGRKRIVAPEASSDSNESILLALARGRRPSSLRYAVTGWHPPSLGSYGGSSRSSSTTTSSPTSRNLPTPSARIRPRSPVPSVSPVSRPPSSTSSSIALRATEDASSPTTPPTASPSPDSAPTSQRSGMSRKRC